MRSRLVGQIKKLSLDLKAVSKSDYDDLPTRYFFTRDIFLANANYAGNGDAMVLAERSEILDVIKALDRMRDENELDALDIAIFIVALRSELGFGMSEARFDPDGLPRPGWVGQVVVEAFWDWDAGRHSEDYAWRHQRDWKRFERDAGSRINQPGSKIRQIIDQLREPTLEDPHQ